jgi:hypothetical protein
MDGPERDRPWQCACALDHDRHRASNRAGGRAGLRLRPDRAAFCRYLGLVSDPGGDAVSAASPVGHPAWGSWVGTADRPDWRRGGVGADGYRGDVARDFTVFTDLERAEPRRDFATATAVARRYPAGWQKTDGDLGACRHQPAGGTDKIWPLGARALGLVGVVRWWPGYRRTILRSFIRDRHRARRLWQGCHRIRSTLAGACHRQQGARCSWSR